MYHAKSQKIQISKKNPYPFEIRMDMKIYQDLSFSILLR